MLTIWESCRPSLSLTKLHLATNFAACTETHPRLVFFIWYPVYSSAQVPADRNCCGTAAAKAWTCWLYTGSHLVGLVAARKPGEFLLSKLVASSLEGCGSGNMRRLEQEEQRDRDMVLQFERPHVWWDAVGLV